MENKNSTKIIRKLFLTLLPVQALAVGLPAINALVSSFVIGNYIGPSALAAIGFASPLNNCVAAVSSTLAVGSQLLCGQYLGQGDKQGVRQSFCSASALCCLLGLGFTAACVLAPGGISRLLGASAESAAMTADYIRGLGTGMVFIVLSATLLPFLQLDRAAKTASAAVVTMVAVNIGFNLLNAFVLHWGMMGVGLSTAAANLASVLVCLPHFVSGSQTFRFSAKDIHGGTVGKIFYLGLPSAVSPVCLVFRDRVINQYVFNLGGTAAMSAMAVANNLSSGIGAAIEGGYSGSANLLSSVLVGERDRQSLTDLPRTMIRSISGLYLAAYAIVFFFAKPLALLFGAEPEFIEVYVLVIRLFNLWFVTNIFKSPTICIYRALGMVKTVSVFYALNTLVFPVAACLLLSGSFGLAAPVSTPWISEILLVASYIVYYRIREGRMPRSLAYITSIPEDLSVPEEDCFAAAIQTAEEAAAASEAVVAFCKSKGLSSRTAYYCGLCLEEMAVDTVTHGFAGSKPGQYTIDLRLCCKDGGVTVLLRDNCPHFDPTEWLALYAPEDPSRSIGIKMVAQLAKKMDYSSTLGLNVLTIEL